MYLGPYFIQVLFATSRTIVLTSILRLEKYSGWNRIQGDWKLAAVDTVRSVLGIREADIRECQGYTQPCIVYQARS